MKENTGRRHVPEEKNFEPGPCPLVQTLILARSKVDKSWNCACTYTCLSCRARRSCDTAYAEHFCGVDRAVEEWQ